jgi:hypothetical protein
MPPQVPSQSQPERRQNTDGEIISNSKGKAVRHTNITVPFTSQVIEQTMFHFHPIK